MDIGKNFDGLKTPISKRPLIRICSICLDDVDLDHEAWTSIIVNGRRAFYHRSCCNEERDQ
jgi:hypothetical protein